MKSPTQAPQTQQRVRCLVIQLARLGDSIQSLMALRAAKQLYPQLEIHFLVRERFAAAARKVPWLANVITLPTDRLIGPILDGTKPKNEGIGDLARWVAPLVQSPWDFIINWSYSESSSYLTGLLPGRVKLGYSRRNDATFSCLDGWSHYMQAVVQGSIEQNIHLTDILTTQFLTALQIHVGDPLEEAGNSAVTSKAFFTLQMTEREMELANEKLFGTQDLTRKWIGFQLGASHSSKTWSPSRWAQLARMILKRHSECHIVLLGGDQEKELESRFFEALKAELPEVTPRESSRVVSMVGKTSFDLWASLVGRCQWLMAGDTAAIHLASVLGTRVLNISTGPVRWAETGPYGNGHYVVTTAAAPEGAHSCGDDVTPESVYATWTYATGEWTHRKQLNLLPHFDELGFQDHAQKVRVFRSKIRSPGDGGGVLYEPMLQQPLQMNEWLSQAMGHIARAWYCGWTPPIGHELNRSSISPTLIQSLRRLKESTDVLLKICEQAKKAANEIHLKCTLLRSDKVMSLKDREQLRDLSKKLADLDQLVERLAATDEALMAFAQMSKVLMHNLRGNQLAEMGRESAESYRQLGQGVAILRDWVEHTLNLAKPVAIKDASVISLERGASP